MLEVLPLSVHKLLNLIEIEVFEKSIDDFTFNH